MLTIPMQTGCNNFRFLIYLNVRIFHVEIVALTIQELDMNINQKIKSLQFRLWFNNLVLVVSQLYKYNW